MIKLETDIVKLDKQLEQFELSSQFSKKLRQPTDELTGLEKQREEQYELWGKI